MLGWTVVLPVKPWSLAKARLLVPDSVRPLLARAFALDVLDALRRSPDVGHVVIVTAEGGLRSEARHDTTVLVDRPLVTVDPLNAAILIGRAWALTRRQCQPIVVVPSDVACLTPEALANVFAEAAGRRGIVVDAAGVGTAMLLAPRPAQLLPAYGPGSAEAHRLLGYVEVARHERRARLDVDTLSDLSEARRLGLGARASETEPRTFHLDSV